MGVPPIALTGDNEDRINSGVRPSDTSGAPAYADVALLRAFPGRDALTYAVPTSAGSELRIGMRVVAPLGGRRETGLVVALRDVAPDGVAGIRAIDEVLDHEPIVSAEVFALCRWTARYYLAGLSDVLAVALPGGLRARAGTVLRLVDDAPATQSALEAAIVAHLKDAGPAAVSQLARALGWSGVARAGRALLARGIVVAEERRRRPSVTTRYVTLYSLARELTVAEHELLARRAPRQAACYERLRAAAGRRLAAGDLDPPLRHAAEVLTRRGVAQRAREERYRDTGSTAPAAPEPALTSAQADAVDAVDAGRFQVYLLHGITGSGKTEVYLQLAARARAAGRAVLLLVPEIALTHQLVVRAQQRFGSAVALVHSGLAPGQRWDEWRRVARGEAHVVIGTRSAVFAPLVDIGLVVVDEEHDPAYKQDEGLRYHGRDLAIVRAKLAGIPIVLGSATPSVESHQQALAGRYRRLSLPERVHGRPLPEVTLVDLRSPSGRPIAVASDAAAPTTPPGEPEALLFSPTLLDAMRTALGRNEQVLLFLNRRGFANALHCLVCGEPAGCPSCSVSLTLHRRRAALLCHHCGYARSARDTTCHACRRGALVALGLGTERVEAEVARIFPAARAARLDRDTTTRPGSHRRILEAWGAGRLDVLIGTQMVTKGHDVPGVTLVGVLLADVALGMPDFRAAERAFQLLTQVAGRAGRGDVPGRVIVQTYRPAHHSLVAAAAHDYAGFAPAELAARREVGYPPFVRLAVVRLEGADSDRTGKAAEALAERSRAACAAKGVQLRGPAPAPLERLRGRHRWQLILSAPDTRPLHDVLRELQQAWRTSPEARAIRLVVDVDPVSML